MQGLLVLPPDDKLQPAGAVVRHAVPARPVRPPEGPVLPARLPPARTRAPACLRCPGKAPPVVPGGSTIQPQDLRSAASPGRAFRRTTLPCCVPGSLGYRASALIAAIRL